ncbi:hypothetical protein AK812_SmicGene26153 [Symbiodinium microadriaticum]|uniref:Uncharacterized protein n=1 Tax=Symbiodinium microadriaticum TaxID=2951 RepID=A0A1Q9DAC3_SYMMI|nr:hypothetical protein AK812_SmicGene26153 [Symbiodinium microadriaticum]
MLMHDAGIGHGIAGEPPIFQCLFCGSIQRFVKLPLLVHQAHRDLALAQYRPLFLMTCLSGPSTAMEGHRKIKREVLRTLI